MLTAPSRVLGLAWLLLATALAADPATPAITFLDPAAGRQAIVDERMEPYFSLLQTQEMSSKTGSPISGKDLDEQRAECRKRYQDAVVAFTPGEQAGITAAIAAVHPTLAAAYPVFAAEPWQFVKVDRRIEGGLPHTRGHVIVLSDTVMGMFPSGPGRKPNLGGACLLVHEQCHVVQRHYPQRFAELYTGAWGFIRMAKEPAVGGDLLRHQLRNPDGVDCVWAIPLTIDDATVTVQPQVIYGSDEAVPRMPDDFQELALEVESRDGTWVYRTGPDGRPLSQRLGTLTAYQERFAPSQENFHPNEICAELFSNEVIAAVRRTKGSGSPCVRQLLAWARTAFARPAP